jgi:uncharacterized protein YjbI with pentapeptide repeats
MANEEHLAQLKRGVGAWNQWRKAYSEIRPDLANTELHEAHLTGANLFKADLSEADLREAHLTGAHLFSAHLIRADLTGADLFNADLTGADLGGARLAGALLGGADLHGAHLHGVDLQGAHLFRADLTGADLHGAHLRGADLRGADLRGADLRGAHFAGAHLAGADFRKADLSEAHLAGADFREADLSEAHLAGADLSGANLTRAVIVKTNFEEANLMGCSVYGIAAWNVNLLGAQQSDLIITQLDEPVITVDNLEVAQFIYLLLHNDKIREVMDTITSKAVLILGRFTPERKVVLDAIREELRRRNYLPILFDFEKPANRDLTETVATLAHMARFIIADLTEPSSLPKELEAIVPTLAVPVQPVMEGVTRPYAMFPDYWKYSWVLKVYRYESLEGLIAALGDEVIANRVRTLFTSVGNEADRVEPM